MGKKKGAKSIYSVHPSIAMVEQWVDELPEKTGRSLDEWMKLVKKLAPTSGRNVETG